jgi:general secretion pathway protein B
MILDALRRADAERERGSVPGLHAQPVAPLSVDRTSRRPALRWHWIAIGALAVVVVALAWLIAGRDAPRPASAEPAPPIAAAPVPPARPAQPMPEQARQPVAEAAPWPQPEQRNALAPAAPSVRPDAKASPSAAPAQSPIYARDQLPEAIRAALPPLTFGGSMYSSNPANRTLVVNGGLYRENDQLTADLALEQIMQKAAVFRFRGYRFEVPY